MFVYNKQFIIQYARYEHKSKENYLYLLRDLDRSSGNFDWCLIFFFSWRYNPHWGLYFTAL